MDLGAADAAQPSALLSAYRTAHAEAAWRGARSTPGLPPVPRLTVRTGTCGTGPPEGGVLAAVGSRRLRLAFFIRAGEAFLDPRSYVFHHYLTCIVSSPCKGRKDVQGLLRDGTSLRLVAAASESNGHQGVGPPYRKMQHATPSARSASVNAIRQRLAVRIFRSRSSSHSSRGAGAHVRRRFGLSFLLRCGCLMSFPFWLMKMEAACRSRTSFSRPFGYGRRTV